MKVPNSTFGIMCANEKPFSKSQLKYIEANVHKLFINSCKYGFLEFSKYLHENYYILYSDLRTGFAFACANGHIKTFKWITSLSKDYAYDTDAFISACKNGHLKIVQLLCEIYDHADDSTISQEIKSYYNIGFAHSCAYGHKKVAKWLYDTYPNDIDIRAMNDFAFERACQYQHESVATWLFSLCNNYSMSVYRAEPWHSPCISFKIKSFKDDLKNIFTPIDPKGVLQIVTDEQIIMKLAELYKDIVPQISIESVDDECPICMQSSDTEVIGKYKIILQCDHTLCAKCFAQYDKKKCYYRCETPIDPDNVKLKLIY